MNERRNPYFLAAMHHAKQEAACSDNAASFARQRNRLPEREAGAPSTESQLPGASRPFADVILEYLEQKELEDGERHARVRKKLEPFL
jgi:hypothetical protein